MSAPDLEQPFNEPWEASAFAMTVRLHEKGVFTWTEWAEVLGAAITLAPTRPYYESWLVALERIVEAKAVVDSSERHGRIAAWDRAARATPHGQPIELVNATPSYDFRPV